MFGIGPMELLVISVAALLFIGPKRLPGAMRQLGKIFVQARRHTEEFRSGFQGMMRDAEQEVRMEELNKLKEEIKDLKPVSTVSHLLDHKLNQTSPGDWEQAEILPKTAGQSSGEHLTDHYDDNDTSTGKEKRIEIDSESHTGEKSRPVGKGQNQND